MQRRSFLTKSALGATAGVIAAPALAQINPEVKWRMASSFPKSLDTIFGSAEAFTKRVAELTGGRFQIRQFAAGDIVPGLQVMDAVQAGTVEMGHTPSYYYFGKDATFAFDCAVPFGLTSRQQTAWFDQGGGRELMRDFFKGYGIINFMAGNTGTQMGGWYRKEIKSLEDVKGMKIRIAGFAGRVMERMGAVPQQIPAGDVYAALEKGTIDAAEWVGPYDDEKLGLAKVAPHYYAPGWWEAGPQLSFYVNIKEWEKLPAQYKAALEAASFECHVTMQAEYDTKNPAALARLIKNGAKLHTFSKAIMDEAYKISTQVMEEEASKNAKFKKVYDPWKRFRQDQNMWASVSEQVMQNYLISIGRK
ncbi:TRAP transporter substrate-binding protein [Massilia antarctica]|uniref:TRAP transporter substrate-binding protein n=1 Tax=Massilia antarctica TaxID=2765360 RepID=UPI0006BB8BA7|nr:TRAP transporter substrate-binding protein [Massilia sp. H27-R4]MCY0913476.1 TRAP transporter substrate-binding protein [Massilia sp. H27-R4]CUI09613.1 TRAP transporter solute receptor, unknown substrate 6 [Janthinobacterium sp. CG23_2]CUU33399.1 TRAP transporter solute receptor, unknown substrate 6 [Janthinobacterium sp. CG23_2]